MWCPNEECPDAAEQGQPAEFVEGKLECTFCGAALVPSMPAWAAPGEEEKEEIRLVPVMPIASVSWLPRVKAILDAAEVRFLVKKDGLNQTAWGTGGTGFSPGDGSAAIMVQEGDFARATEALRLLKSELGLDPGDAPPELTAPAWQPSACPQCGKTLETGEDDEPLAYCYHCGASLS